MKGEIRKKEVNNKHENMKIIEISIYIYLRLCFGDLVGVFLIK